MSYYSKIALGFLSLFSVSAGFADFPQDGYRSLFDGKSLHGWEGSPEYWRVEAGAIVGEIPKGQRLEKNHWLIWKGGNLGDFELRLQFRLSGEPNPNSGIQFRCQAEGINKVSGYQADLDLGPTWLGRIYDEHGRRLLVERGASVLINEKGERSEQVFADKDQFSVLFRENEWNDYRIIACDEYISVYVNGTLFSRLIDREEGERDLTGHLAIQLHSGLQTRAEFRNIQVRELKSGDHRFDFNPTVETDTNAQTNGNPILSHLVPNQKQPKGNGSETVGNMLVPDGFRVETIAAEPDLHQPIAFTFDERGRIWAIEAHSYPSKRLPGKGLDKIVIFEDVDADGSYESRKVFVEGLNLASGLELGFGGVWVGAAPELLFIPDRDGDDRPDSEPVVLLDGFGYQDTHETMNSFTWGPDGWLYGLQGIFNYAKIGKPSASNEERETLTAGVWRYHPTKHEFEIFAHGGSNPWGLDFNEMGQLFMTHCRSYWGRGPITQVVQGGHFWKQSNRGHADFVSGTAPDNHEYYRNFLLASARYGHGEGGAGKPGSRTVYGGHSLVGTMVYLGDNWPDEYRDHLFSHNLHGHQLNNVINVPEGSGYNTIHAGFDMLYAPEPTYVGVELKYGPDGSVIFSDWVDLQHCHNPKAEQWDRGNGRLYRMAWTDTYKPVKIDLASNTDKELVDLLFHKNDWYVRMARRLLQERAESGSLSDAKSELELLTTTHVEPAKRLRALWALYAINGLSDAIAFRCLADENEYVRAWTIQLVTDDRNISSRLSKQFILMAKSDPSPVVRRYLASAVQRVPAPLGWKLCEQLAGHGEDENDRYLPKMIWYGLADLMNSDADRAFKLAANGNIERLNDFANWYGAKLGGRSLDKALKVLASEDNPESLMEAVALGLEDQRDLPMPSRWKTMSKKLYESSNKRVAELARSIGAAFGDTSLYPHVREILADKSEPLKDRLDAFTILAESNDADSLDLLVSLLDDPDFSLKVIQFAPQLNRTGLTEQLIGRFHSLSEKEKAAAMNALTKRESMAVAMLDAIEDDRINRRHLMAYHARELSVLNSSIVDERLSRVWGRVNETPEELQTKIDKLDTFYSQAPRWAFKVSEGQSHFNSLCSACHQPNDTSSGIGPDLTGSGSNGVRYFLENIIDPNAVVGNDYELSVVETKSGQVVSGMIEKSTDTAVSIRTISDVVTIGRSDIENLTRVPQSLMPPGLLDTLNETQQVELLKYLSSL